MPTTATQHRAATGAFVPSLIVLLGRRAEKFKQRFRLLRPLVLRSPVVGVMMGLMLAHFSFSILLLRCGDVEANPGPPKVQTRLTNNKNDKNANADTSRRESMNGEKSEGGGEPSLRDIMQALQTINSRMESMDSKMDTKLEGLRQEMADSFENMKKEMQELHGEVDSLKKANTSLKQENEELRSQVHFLDSKVDDLENRSRRSNLLIEGLPRLPNETPEQCEKAVCDLFKEKFDLNVGIDRAHRLNGKPKSPVIVCFSSYKDKVKVLKEKSKKLKDTDVFMFEDLSARVREIRKKLLVHLKEAKKANKKAIMIYDHLVIEGKNFFLSPDGFGIYSRVADKAVSADKASDAVQ